jgi:tetrapyrrole methylase family protein / MazG family protein
MDIREDLMTSTTITILGLGPGSVSDLTLQAYNLLQEAAHNGQTVYFRTLIHPTVDALKQDIPDLQIASFDQLYDESADWGALYQQIAEKVCALATQQSVIYAVPGHPLIGESSVQLILQLARQRGLRTTIVAGLSFLEPVCTLVELDPFEAGLQLIDATNLAALGSDEIAGKIVPTTALLVAQLYNRRLASAVKIALSECYPDEWPVKLVRAAGVNTDEAVIEMPLYELDRNSHPNHLCTLYVPPVDALTSLRVPETLRYITMRLRRDPDGCPWDRQQTHQSLTRYLVEETYEVLETLEENNMDKLADELGDLLLQVYLHAEIARQEEDFTIGDVFEHINAKLIRRHPHVFADTSVSGAEQVVQNWEAIKQQERITEGQDPQTQSILDGVTLAAPALTVSQKYQARAASVGFEHPTIARMYAKVQEEILELQEATTPEHRFEELGDVLFVVVKLAQAFNIDAEQALRAANRKFRQRFRTMEEIARQAGRELSSYSSPEWGELWKRAKAL